MRSLFPQSRGDSATIFDMQWDDLRLALAIAEEGSTTKAARKLGVAHTTVARRLATLERDAGVRLFERAENVLVPTAAGAKLVALASDFGARIADFAEAVVDVDNKLEGSVTVTAAELLSYFLARHLPAFHETYPAIQLRLRVTPTLLDLSRREADIAIRVNPPETPELVGKRVGHSEFAVYGTNAKLKMQDARWVVTDDELATSAQSRWEQKHVDPTRIALRTNSRSTFVEAIRAGVGVGVLPCAYADADPSFTRKSPPITSMRAPMWVLVHASQRLVPRVRATSEFLTQCLKSASKSP